MSQAERAMSFGVVAELYDRLRPSPPTDAVAWLVPETAGTVLDLGAGTGAMTRRLLGRGRIIAVEPDERMRAVLARRSPTVEVLAGSSSDIPLADHSVDAVVVASAWHWMDPETAVPEIARVLTDGGRFGVVWTGRDTRADWVRDILATQPERSLPRALRELHLPEGSPFEAPQRELYAFHQAMSIDELADGLATYSAVIAQGPEAAARIVEQARESLQTRFGAGDCIDVPFRALAYRTTRIPRGLGFGYDGSSKPASDNSSGRADDVR